MGYKVRTEEGSITVFKEVIVSIVTKTMEQFEGKVLITNQKGKRPNLMAKIGGKEETGTIEISNGKKGLDIRIFVLIRFGSSISQTTELMIDQIKTEVEKGTGIPVDSVSIVIRGVFSKQIAKRNIEIKKET